MGIVSVLPEVIAALTEALPGYIIEHRILDPILANQFSYHDGRDLFAGRALDNFHRQCPGQTLGQKHQGKDITSS